MLKSLKRSFGALMVSSLINYSRTRNRLVQKETTIFHQRLIAENDVRGQRKNDLSSPSRRDTIMQDETASTFSLRVKRW